MKNLFKTSVVLLGLVLAMLPFRTSAETSWNGWERVSDFGFGRGPDYFETLPFAHFWHYKDYIVASAVSQTGRAQVYKSSDGKTWETSGQPGFGENNTFIYTTSEFNGFLYASTLNETKGSQIWRTWDLVNWEKVADNAFGYGDQSAIFTLQPFNGALYAGTIAINNSGIGGQIWRSTNGKDGWTRVTSPGNGEPTTYSVTFTMAVFKDYLYTSFWTEGGGQIYRTADGTNWEWPTGRGIDDPANTIIYLGQELNGELYLGVDRQDLQGGYTSQGRVYKTSDGVHWQRVELSPNINYQTWVLWPTLVYNGWLYFSTITQSSGGEIWRYNGSEWQQFVDGGFGDHDSDFVYIGVEMGGYLYAGTDNNVDGGSIWRRAIEDASTQNIPTLPETGPATSPAAKK